MRDRITAGLRYDAVDAQDDRARFARYLDRVHELPEARAYKARSLDRLELRPGMCVLDVGGGTGGDAMTLAARVTQTGRVLAVDLSWTLLTEARRKLRDAPATHIDLLCADVTALPFPNDSWDRVRADRVLQHVPDTASAVREMTRVLKPEGVLVVCDVDWETLVLDHPARETTCAVLRQRVQSAPSGTVGRALLRHCVDAGLHAVDAEATTFTFRHLSLADPILGLRKAASALAESNETDLDQLAEWLTTMEELDRRGRFFCAVTGFAAWGRKPSEVMTSGGR